MGFYAPAEIVRDAINHQVIVHAPDVNHSDWDNTLERGESGSLDLRLGFRQITGFRDAWAETISKKRGNGFPTIEQLIRRTTISKPTLTLLAESDALRSLGLDRREGLWFARRLPEDTGLPLFDAMETPDLAEEIIAPLPGMPLSEHVISDYQTMRLSLKGDPMQFLRGLFASERAISCAEVANARDGQRAKCAGVILVRQMPGTAGVVFITLRDETGIANVVVWPSVFDQFRKEVMGSRLLLVEGKIQRSPEGVVHLVSDRLVDRSREIDRLSDDELKVTVHADQIPPPPDSRGMHTHPRNVRIIPKSRDFR